MNATATPETYRPFNPGDNRNCSDFATQAAAQTYFDVYYRFYGDVSKLDEDNNRRACELLP